MTATKQNSERLTPQQEISEGYVEYVVSPTAVGRSAIRYGSPDSTVKGAVQDWVDQGVSDILSGQSEAVLGAEKLVSDAREFIERLTGIRVEAPVIWQDYVPTSTIGGTFYPILGIVTAVSYERDPGIANPSKHYELFRDMGTLIHEFMHATGATSRRVVVVRKINETLVRCSFGMRTIRLRQHSDPSDRMEPGGDFLEEACAEEAASRWREWMEPTRKYVTQEHTHAMGDEPPLPWRYLNTDVGLYWGSRDADIVWCGYSWSAYCAEAIRLIGEHTGEDIFALMVEARDPVKEAEAKRKIVRTIDSVEPGLYKKLRDLQYSREAFIEGYELVVGALKRARSRDELREVA